MFREWILGVCVWRVGRELRLEIESYYEVKVVGRVRFVWGEFGYFYFVE